MNIRERRFALPIRASLFISLAICMVSLWSIFGSAAETEPADSSPASAVQAGRSEDGDDPGTAGALRKAEALKYTGIVAEGEESHEFSIKESSVTSRFSTTFTNCLNFINIMSNLKDD